ncbi:DUF4251 domain-containing protein [Winogradskyella alexanderae]|uniref:DUF4251 domain-containing protein n=1 Tax=Winogradskyella alexanderae TaxID=2877123 RepID=A0ABS7XSL6_9FLAO|nr:DUF4251 domain-containing protein [Winogradskyella alexanderae]MCA0132765.1 DUF4251 domain-containing protein [Winogradskyella alexanderae]
MKYSISTLGKLLLVVTVLGIGTISSLHAQDNNKKKDSFERTYNNSLQTVEYGNFKFSANLIYDGMQREKNLSTLKINNSQLEGSLLPFSDNETGLIQLNKQALREYKVYSDERNKIIEVSFNTTVHNFNYQFKIKIMPNGNSILNVINNRDSIEYRGIIERI